MQSPYNSLTEDYTQIFYMIDKRDIPFFRYMSKMSLGGPKSTKKVDILSLIFIDYYVPMLT
jgi:hypothetical protein